MPEFRWKAVCLIFTVLSIPALPMKAGAAGPAPSSPGSLPAQKAQVAESYGKLQLSFETNTGQADESIRFLARGSGYGLFLTDREAVLSLRKSGCAAKPEPVTEKSGLAGDSGNAGNPLPPMPGDTRHRFAGCRDTTALVRMQLAGASKRTAAPTGEDLLTGKVNYFMGKDQAKWKSNIPTYGKVHYSGVYPGVDLVYYGNQQQLEYDFVVAAGADPNRIRLRFAGATEMRLGKDGDLAVTAGNGELDFHQPVVYQTVDGERKPVEGSFALLRNHTVGFKLGSYDRSKPLVIDPVLVYSTYFGGSIASFYAGNPYTVFPQAIAVDSQGNTFIAGVTGGNIPTTPGAFDTNDGWQGGNYFISKINPEGTALIYSTYLGGISDWGYLTDPLFYNRLGFAIDSSGNAYIAGATNATNAYFPVTPGAYQTQIHSAAPPSGCPSYSLSQAPANGFVTKLSPDGSSLVYSTYLGGSGSWLYGSDKSDCYGQGDEAYGLALDGSGDAYITGSASSADFPVTQGAFQTSNHANTKSAVCPTDSSMLLAPSATQAFVTKLNSIGTALIYSTYLGGSGSVYPSPSDSTPGCGFIGDAAMRIALDSSGSTYITGNAGSADFPITSKAYQATGMANRSVPVACNELGAGLPSNPFVAKLKPDGSGLEYSTFLGGSGIWSQSQVLVSASNSYVTLCSFSGDSTNALAVDNSGNAYIAGTTVSTDFPVTSGAVQTTNRGAAIGTTNGFVAKLNSTGSALVYSTYLGGSGSSAIAPGTNETEEIGDGANGLALDSAGNAYITGVTTSKDFPLTPSACQATNLETHNSGLNGGTAFLAELNPAGNSLVYSSYLGGSGNSSDEGDSGQSLTVDGSGNVYIAGLTSSGDFPVTPGAFMTANPAFYSGNGFYTAFITKTNPTASATPTSTVKITPPAVEIDAAQSLTLTVAVEATAGGCVLASSAAATPTGSVTLTSGSYSATLKLNAGSAAFTLPAGTLSAGTDTVTANYSGDGNYPAASNTATATVDLLTPTMTLTPASTSITAAQALTVTAAVNGGSGNPAPTGSVTLTVPYPSTTYTASLSNGTATFTLPAGSLTATSETLTATYVPDAASANIYSGTTAQSPSVSVTNATVTVVPSATSLASSTALTATATVSGIGSTATPTGQVHLIAGSYSSAYANLSGGSYTFTIPAGSLSNGANTVTVYYEGDTAFHPATGTATVTVGSVPAITPTVAVTPSPTSITTAQPLTVIVAVGGGSGNPTPTGSVTLSSGSYTSAATVLTNGSATINVPAGTLAVGTDSLSASYTPDSASSSTYNSATGTNTVSVTAPVLTAQTITFANPGAQTVGTPLTLSATATSGLAVSFASTTASICTVVGTQATFLAAGTCTIGATQAGNSTYAAATMVAQSFTVNAAPLTAQTITFANPGAQTVGAPLTLAATTTSGLAVSFASTTAGVCTVSGTQATFLAAGTCTIDANQAGNSTYAAAPMVAQSFTVNAAPLTAQTIAFANPGAQTVGTPMTLAASATSGLAVSFASTTAGVCTVSGTQATFLAAGTCTIDANQAGNSTYAAAPMVAQSFTVNAAPLTAQTIAFANPGAQTVGTPLTLSATATSGLAVSFASTTASVCTVSGAQATFLATGACTIDAMQAGNSTYAAATMVAQSFTVNAAPTPTFTVGSSSGAQTVQPGGVATYTINITPANGSFAGSVTLSASGLPASATYNFSPASVTPGSAGASSSMTIQTAATTTTADVRDSGWPLAAPALALLVFIFVPGEQRRRWITLGVLLLASLGALTGCGGGFALPKSSTPISYAVTVTGTSGSYVQNTTVQLTVQ